MSYILVPWAAFAIAAGGLGFFAGVIYGYILGSTKVRDVEYRYVKEDGTLVDKKVTVQ